MDEETCVIRLYNTLTREKEVFRPIDPARVRLYVCGPTVYDRAHIGNARPIIVFDVLFRLLRYTYGPEHVVYARNITDVDDKINARAAERGIPIHDLTAKTIADFHEDVAALGCLEPTVEPRATGHIAEMVALIETLIEKGHAYAAEGHALFDVGSMPDYGSLARRSLDEMLAGARVDVAPYKKNPMDFVLWKPSKSGEPAWDSPWGKGRPGWHIECSAMSKVHLGEVFDIHGGGIDLVFPHHENEIAQSRCAHGTNTMANIWMHNGFLQVEGEKMAKSAGNFITIRDLLNTTVFGGWPWPGSVVRFAMLKTHYRQPIDWTVSLLEEAAIELDKFATWSFATNEGRPSDEFLNAISDDLNMPMAIAELHRLADEARGLRLDLARRAQSPGAMIDDADYAPAEKLAASLRLIGIDIGSFDPNWLRNWRSHGLTDDARFEINRLVLARRDARKSKDFAEADRIRDELAGMGIKLMDRKNPDTGELETEWEVER